VPHDQLPPEADFDQINSSLNDGLKTCRAMVANYRSLLASDLPHMKTAANDLGEDAPEAGSGGE
jgi:hypothetical protein